MLTCFIWLSFRLPPRSRLPCCARIGREKNPFNLVALCDAAGWCIASQQEQEPRLWSLAYLWVRERVVPCMKWILCRAMKKIHSQLLLSFHYLKPSLLRLHKMEMHVQPNSPASWSVCVSTLRAILFHVLFVYHVFLFVCLFHGMRETWLRAEDFCVGRHEYLAQRKEK